MPSMHLVVDLLSGARECACMLFMHPVAGHPGGGCMLSMHPVVGHLSLGGECMLSTNRVVDHLSECGECMEFAMKMGVSLPPGGSVHLSSYWLPTNGLIVWRCCP